MSAASRRAAAAVLLGTLSALLAPTLRAYALIGGAWPTGNIPLQLQLDATVPAGLTLPLMDGSTSWDAVAESAMNDWNAALVGERCQLTAATSTSTAATQGDGINSVFFSKTVYGQSFGNQTLAVTLVDDTDSDGVPGVRIHEADLIVNAGRDWDSYRGTLRTSPLDLRRVLLHEMGHVLGLDHPDTANPPQTVTAIMNSTISDVQSIQSDDRAGLAALYGTPLVTPTVTTQPANQTATVTGSAAFTLGINGGAAPPPGNLLSYTWYFRATGATAFERLFTIDAPSLDFGSVQPSDAGAYYVEITTPDRTVDSDPATLTTNPVTTSANTVLLNVSTRGMVDSGSGSLIAGFVVTGTHSKTILLRAVGPTLANYGVSGTLPDPVLTLTNSAHATLATSPAIWDQDSTTAATLRDTMSRVGAFPLPAGSRDAAILATLPPGGYTATVSSASGASGTVLVEVYDADSTHDPASRVVNLSTRGYVGSGDKILIAGFAVQGPGPHTYLLRVASESLQQYGVTGVLTDPILTLFDANGHSLRVNDDWDSPSASQPALNAAFQKVGAFPFPYPSTVNGTRDPSAMQPAMLVTLQPGNYTAQVTGNANQGTTSTTGNALIEIYEVQ